MADRDAGPLPRPVGAAQRSILTLAQQVRALPEARRAVFERLIRVTEAEGRLIVPEPMRPWVVERFGSLEAVERQTVVKTTNLVTLEGTLFNPLRASRPIDAAGDVDLDAEIATSGDDPFCRPLEGTPADTFGRVKGRHAITASNVAKYDALHAVVVFGEHNPLRFDADSIADAIDVALEWGRRALAADAEAKYLFLMWNCLWKSGASIVHGHAQVAATRDLHYPKVERLRRQALAYRQEHGASYFADLVAAHRALGLVTDFGDTAIVASLTPIKEKETLLVAPAVTPDLRRAIAHALERLVHHLGMKSFNLALYLPPMAPAPEDWGGFPALTRIVDRGAPLERTADVGAMELFAASVVTNDPFRVAEALRR